MAGRTIAIGDIHGCAAALKALIEAIGPDSDDTIVTLGDHIDRGTNCRVVVDLLIALHQSCRLIPLIGDHEQMLLDAFRDKDAVQRWLRCGGKETLRSYGWSAGKHRRGLMDWFPKEHREFFAACQPYYETDTHIFVHAGLVPELPLHLQPAQALQWRVTDLKTATRHQSGKVVIVGHTAQLSGAVLDLGYLICIDTNCARGGWLTALEISTGRIWQADREGRLRTRTG